VGDEQERIAEPGAGKLLGKGPQFSPGFEIARLIVPPKLFSDAVVIVEVAVPWISTMDGGVAERVKSWNCKSVIALWTSVPLDPVVVRV